MEKIWYIKIYGNREGPYSILDLMRDKRITPDTLVWRRGFDCWQPIRYVPELQKIFEDDKETVEKEYEDNPKPTLEDTEIVLDMSPKPFNKWMIIFLVLIFAAYLWIRQWQ